MSDESMAKKRAESAAKRAKTLLAMAGLLPGYMLPVEMPTLQGPFPDERYRMGPAAEPPDVRGRKVVVVGKIEQGVRVRMVDSTRVMLVTTWDGRLLA